MSNTLEVASCLSGAESDTQLTPAGPFSALHYHFGMLLGVDDFETEQAYHRGKIRLHNAWQHREGVVWGLEVRLDKEKGEIRVTRGLALDGSGHELYLGGDACLNVGAWYDKHSDDPALQGKLTFAAHVVIAYKACLARPVPALLEPCDGSGQDTAYSRVQETVEIRLVPGNAPDAPAPPYHLLRLLFGLTPPEKDSGGTVKPEDQAVLDERNRIAALPREEQPLAWLQAFRRFAALDEMALVPAQAQEGEEWTLFPASETDSLVLAEIQGITLEKKNNVWIVGGGEVHNERRSTHVASRAAQELLCAALPGCGGLPADAGGPRVDPDSVVFDAANNKVIFQADSALHEASVKGGRAFAVSAFDETNGWQSATITDASYDSSSKTVTILLTATLSGKVLRLIAQGTGEHPLLGANLVPLAGSIADPPATGHNGKDFVFMKTGS